ncbi:response regulator transcription factor [Pseudoalteromonas denitrificans]|uniref:DNA-binding response regulator, OmpR family, contains REC and winged-helix (WHTH) domain n=1 Tax=Pseudoalteromonas denitrificans DSM 6059 TaxID=1123010 RepID=A0A1I1SYH3_9GAMM|nr:response regulator transcription factor [Pseudoalteromonas denitrificans]SFD51504.1 DNA-binding response regulator, OmpR family, contains REC and winged-helix (wHTH) domain [Pseudoalteromonas denitrificans DSM 6059]
MRVLVVDDNYDIASSIVDYLEYNKHHADFAINGSSMLELVAQNSYDVIILDVMMPGLSGYEACEKLRQELMSNIPVLFLTARDTLKDKLQGFTAGADDYLVKPFAMEELLARANALSLRAIQHNTRLIEVFDIEIDLQKHSVKRQGSAIELPPNQFKLLVLLAKKSPDVVGKRTMEYTLWGEDIPDSDVLRSQMYQLRNKIDKPFSTALIKTIHKIGFKLAPNDNL